MDNYDERYKNEIPSPAVAVSRLWVRRERIDTGLRHCTNHLGGTTRRATSRGGTCSSRRCCSDRSCNSDTTAAS